ncbi:MAG: response regulator transcription factor [Chloroflexi bacterium]|nr:response regulator transcription factor [Chloroflexota bacterium]
MEDKIRVYIVAEFEPLRVGLVGSIAAVPDMEVVGEASSMEGMVLGDGHRGADILLVDVEALNRANMPALEGRLNEWMPGLKVLFLGTQQDAANIQAEDIPAYMSLDAVGFLLKDGPVDRLILAMRMLACGAFVCEMDAIKRILTRLTRWASYSGGEQTGQLSDREMEVLLLVARAKANKEIAQELFLSEGTVRAHVTHIMAKLGVERRTELVRYALARGLSPLEE